jgi:uncharacterized Fe-S cluster protein YjdI
VRVPKRLQVFGAEDVTVTFDPNICIHAEECVRSLPAVIDPTQRRWIRPERAPAAAVTIAVRPGGPLRLRGPVRIVSEAGEVIAEWEAATLCRCSGTTNPPFCDGTHERLGGHRA